MLPTAFVRMWSAWGQQRSGMCTEWMADLLCDPEVTAGPLWPLRDSLLSASQSCSGDKWFSWKRSVNHKMPFCMFIITLAYFGCTKNFFTKKRWTSLENELSMLKNNAEGTLLGVHSSKSILLIWWLQVVQHTQNNLANLYITNPLVWRAFVGLEVKEWGERKGG